AGETLVVGGNRGRLDVQTTGPLGVDSLALGFEGVLTLAAPLTVNGGYSQFNTSSTINSDFPVTVGGKMTWNGGTMTGKDTTFVFGGINIIGGDRTTSEEKRLVDHHLIVSAGSGLFSGTRFNADSSSSFILGENAELDFTATTLTSGMGIIGTSGRPTLINKGRIFSSTNATLSTAWDFINEGVIDLGEPNFTLKANAGLINTGTITGTGTIDGEVLNRGSITPGSGDSPIGKIDINGILTQDSTGRVDIEIGGTGAGSGYDQLYASTPSLNGTLSVALINSFIPDSLDLFSPVIWDVDARTGLFENLEGLSTPDYTFAMQYESDQLLLFDGSLPEPSNLSANVFIGIETSPFTRLNNSVSYTVEVENRGNSTVVVRGKAPSSSMNISSSHFDPCPKDDPYENLKCRVARYGVDLPDQLPEGEEIEFLLDEYYPEFPGSEGDNDLFTGHIDPNGSLSIPGQAQGCTTHGQVASGKAELGAAVTEEKRNVCYYKLAREALKIGANLIPGKECLVLGVEVVDAGITVGRGKLTKVNALDHAFVIAWQALNCATDVLVVGKIAKIVKALNDLARGAGTIGDLFESCQPLFDGSGGGAEAEFKSNCIVSSDPNEKISLDGVLAERYITPQDTVPYTVFFENKESATAPAQVVEISDTLDTDHFDFSTFRFGTIVVATKAISVPSDTTSFTKDVDLRPDMDLILRIEANFDTSTGIISWTFTSLDPATMELTTDPIAGFLPPNVNRPEGEASVSYYADHQVEIASGEKVGTVASIVFDTNDPILTPLWSNIIDDLPPVSQVAALDSLQSDTAFTVSWNGNDSESGVKSYSVFVSENGGAFETWIEQTTDTTAVYNGTDGNEYAFYSIATDFVGFEETEPAGYDAITHILLPPGTPVLAGPANSSTDLTLDLTLDWNSVANADSYRIQLSTSSGFSSTVLDTSGVDGTELNISGLKEGVAYYWRVAGENDSGLGGWSPVWSFTTLVDAPSVPSSLVLETDDNNVTLSWESNTESDLAGYIIYQGADVNALLPTDTLAAVEHTYATTVSGTRFFAVAALDNAGNASPLTSPVSYILRQLSVSDDWQMVSNTLLYQQEVQTGLQLFSFDRTYESDSVLTGGRGYWIKSFDSVMLDLQGQGLDSTSILLNKGWNLIGSLSDTVKAAAIEDPLDILGSPPIYRYDGTSYVETSKLLPGQGHWIFASDTGAVWLSVGSASIKPELSAVAEAETQREQLLDRITFSTENNKTDLLYSPVSLTKKDKMRYLLPPKSPDPVLDIRVEGGFKIGDSEKTKIAFRSKKYPVEVKLHKVTTDDKIYQIEILDGEDQILLTLAPGKTQFIESGSENMYIKRINRDEALVEFSLLPNYPNPFNPSTTIKYKVASKSTVRLNVYDILGRQVQTLVNKEQQPGIYTVRFDGSRLASGVYFIRVQAGPFTQIRKMTLIK
ncbi:MAG: T9SS type A sorting domain-containing protein, partial [Balneolaceae bacterium]|nr:T9SS type A sorting domain-containing protein [Balneolaceae bacterium]